MRPVRFRSARGAVVALTAALVVTLPGAASAGASSAGAPSPGASSSGASSPDAWGGSRGHDGLRVTVLSSRADVVTGGDALVRVDGVRAGRHGGSGVRVTVNGRDVTSSFAVRPGGAYEGLVSGLRNGRNELRATARRQRGAAITLTNHPIGGPVFAGAQV